MAKAYEQLRQQGVIHAQHGKGFYVARTNVKTQMNIFLLFDTLNAYKEVLYNTLTASLPSDTQFSLFFHHYNKALFKSLIDNNGDLPAIGVVRPDGKEPAIADHPYTEKEITAVLSGKLPF